MRKHISILIGLIFLSAVLHPQARGPKSKLTNLGLAGSSRVQIDKERVAYTVDENSEGTGTDLNGDGDTRDLVLHMFDLGFK